MHDDRDNTLDDPALDAAREWMAARPPGLHRADTLPIPPLRTPKVRIIPAYRGRITRMAAAAALVMLGFFAGRASNIPQPSSGGAASRSTARDNAGPPLNQPAAPAVLSPAPVQPAAAPAQLAANRTRRITEDNGRLIIETTLAASGAHATFIVDGNFRLASATE